MHETSVKKLLLTSHITIINEILKARNFLKHQKKVLTNDVIFKKINTPLREIIRINFQKNLRQEILERLKKNFCINDTLCSVIDNDLTMNLYKTKNIKSLFNSTEEPLVIVKSGFVSLILETFLELLALITMRNRPQVLVICKNQIDCNYQVPCNRKKDCKYN